MRTISRCMAGVSFGVLLLGASACTDRSSPPVAPSQPCSFSVSVSASRFGPDGGSANATVSTQASCAWSAASGSEWIAIEGAASRTGDGVVALSVRAFDGTTERAGTITIAQQNFTVTQSGCLVRLGATELAFDGSGGSEDLRIDAVDGCRWMVENAPAWASFDPASGAGPGVTRVRAEKNTAGPRDNIVRVGAQTLTLRQAEFREPAPGPTPRADCSFSASPVQEYIPAAGARGSVAVATAPGCTWTAALNAPHARIIRGASGNGPGEIEYEVDRNPATSAIDFRRAAIEVRWNTPTAGQNVWLLQFTSCGGGPQTVDFPAEGGRYNYTGLTESAFNCPWRVQGQASWLTFTPPAGTVFRGDANFYITAAPNSGPPRSTIIFVIERPVTVTQAGR